MAYGRHQSFYTKNNWINKGIKAIEFDSSLFHSVNSYRKLGIGKNMFLALKYWLEALNIVISDKHQYRLTTFGHYIKKYDPACEKPFTSNLLHFYLTLDEPINGYDKSHSFYFLFNEYDNRSFSKEELINAVINWDTSLNVRSTSEKTIAKDIDCLIQTYTKMDKNHPEDINVSILSKLRLIKKNKDYYTRISIKRENLSLEVFYYILLKLFEKNNSEFLELDIFENSEMSPGRLFNMTRIDIIDEIEELISLGYPIVISRTNNLDTVSINSPIRSEEFIENCFINGGVHG